MGLLRLCFAALLVSFCSAQLSSKVGISYGQLGNNLPTPAGGFKIYDADPAILRAMPDTGLTASVMLPNNLINPVSSNQSLADAWVESKLVPFYPRTKIWYLLVGNEILALPDKSVWYNLVGAMRKVKIALKRHGLDKFKVGTPMAVDVLDSSDIPLNGTIQSDIAARVMKPMLRFLNRTKSYYFLDVYPYFQWSNNNGPVSLNGDLRKP